MELVGAFASTDFGIRFFYDVRYVQRGEEKGEFGISESMPLDFGYYEPQEYAPFFQGLLPEGVVLANLAERYQVPRNDFLAFFEKLGCESIGALTFVAEGSRLTDFKPSYKDKTQIYWLHFTGSDVKNDSLPYTRTESGIYSA